jgi:hypothetical protein
VPDLRRPSLALQILIALAAFGIGVGVAKAAGAVNLGTAFGIGQIVFTAACVFLLLSPRAGGGGQPRRHSDDGVPQQRDRGRR